MCPDDAPHDAFEDPLSNYDPPTYSDSLAQALAEHAVNEIRLIPYTEIAPDATVLSSVQTLASLGISSLLVVKDEQLVGIITERDILERTSEQFARVKDRPVSDVMTANPVVIYDDDPAGAALAAIAASGYRHVPVLNRQGKIVGIVSPRRVFRFLDERMSSSA